MSLEEAPGNDLALSFRRAGTRDVDVIVALVNSAYRGESSKAGWTTEADLLGGQRTDAEEVRGLIEANGSMILLCESGVEVIGTVHLQRAETGAYLGMFTVRPTLQGRGIGSRFMKAAEQAARREWGATKVMMLVIRRRRELAAFYERRGYRRTGETEPFPGNLRYGVPKVERPQLALEVLEKTLNVIEVRDHPAPAGAGGVELDIAAPCAREVDDER